MKPRLLSQRVRMCLVATLVFALLVPAAPASAKTSTTLAGLQKQMAAMKKDVARAGDAFEDAYWELDETEVRLSTTKKKLRAIQGRLKKARRNLGERVGEVYRNDAVTILTVVLDADSFDQFITRMEYVDRVASADVRAIREARELALELIATRDAINKERKAQEKKLAKVRKQRDKLNKRLAAKRSQFEKLQQRISAERARLNKTSGTFASPGPNGMVFPVRGSYYYADTWGASRSGGRRRHKGTDIMAPRGTPCVAVLSGTVRTRENSLGGKTIWLTSDSGWEFYYAHLDRYVVTSGRVRAGQVIGTVGDTGNARGGSPHLHFQMHPGGGAAVNPYPYLRRME